MSRGKGKSTQLSLPSIPTEEDYDKFDQREHIYEKAGMYIGNIDKEEREECVYSDKLNKIVNKFIHFPVGAERLFLEIISNACDNCGKTIIAGMEPGRIEVTMDATTITIKNYGLPIPTNDKKYIENKEEKTEPVPQFIFGNVLCGSNLRNQNRRGIGTNGIGSKAANILSTRFEVYIENAITKKTYLQTWENNMTIRSEPEIKNYKGTVSSVQISYDLEFKKFGYKKYPDEAFELFKKHTIDASFNAKVPVTFNGIEYDYSDIRNYGELYFPIENPILHSEYDGDELITELMVIDSPDEGCHASFVNCMITRNGGVHTEAAYKAVGDKLVKMINERTLKKIGKDMTDRERRACMVNINDIKPHISIILSCKVMNPDFESQSKTKLTKPTPKITIDEGSLKPLLSWQLIKRLEAEIEAKQFAKHAKTDGKKCSFVELEKGVDATDAGSNKSMDCILMCCEGKSPKGYIKAYKSLIENGPAIIGMLPLKGKCLNVMNAKDKKIAENKEIIELKKMLGLRSDMDYTDPVSFKTLRYGQVMICTDADVDGKHIMGLIINFFFCRFPTLLQVPGFLVFKRTPLLRLTKGKIVKRFYTDRECNLWMANNDMKGWKTKYFKGLGTSNKEDVADDLKNEVIVECVYDDDADRAIRLAFDKRLRHERKSWILDWKERADVDRMLKQPISLFFGHEFITFSIANLRRSIPGMDGNKEAHRKIICGLHKRFNINFNKKYKQMKVCNLDNYISDEMDYHHGDQILSDVITKMAQDFVGSNNINILIPDGNFGDLLDGVDDFASGRYLFTAPTDIVPYIYHPDDEPLINYLKNDEHNIEPDVYNTVIPMVLVNGTKGIATGFFTYFPCHNPLDIISWFRQRLHGEIDLPILIPWYKGFGGTITIIDRRKKKKIAYKGSVTNIEEDNVIEEELIDQSDEESLEEVDMSSEHYDDYVDDFIEKETEKENPLLSFDVRGTYHISNKGHIIITELPIGMNPTKYYNKFMVPLIKQKLVKKVVNSSDINRIHFELRGYVGNPNHRKLHLKKRYSLSNMVLLDINNRPVKFDTANDVMEHFYHNRLNVYKQRRAYKLGNLKELIDKNNLKIKYVNHILDKTLIIENVPKATIYENLEILGISKEIYDNSKISMLNAEEVNSLENEIAGYTREHTALTKLKPADIWLYDLKALEDKYKKMNKMK